MVAFNGGVQPGIILLREGTDTSQVSSQKAGSVVTKNVFSICIKIALYQ